MRYVTAQRIREIDRIARERFLIPSIVLMENAGRTVAEEAAILISKKKTLKNKIAIFCGKGNNGGDGFVAARHLRSMGFKPDVFLLTSFDRIKKGDASSNFMCLDKMGIKVHELRDSKAVKKFRRRFKYNTVIDAVYGTGFSGQLPTYISDLIYLVNNYSELNISVDMPSGLDATTGMVYDSCFKADVTVTFGLPKTGFRKNDGPKYVGRVIVRNISYPIRILN